MYGRQADTYIYVYIKKSTVQLVSVGLAQVRPNNPVCLNFTVLLTCALDQCAPGLWLSTEIIMKDIGARLFCYKLFVCD